MKWSLLSLKLWLPGEPDRTFGVPRSPEWRRVRLEFLEEHGVCAACGTTKDLEVHHKKPFHKYPRLELWKPNLITLCEYRGCHFRIGHCFLWSAWNEHCEEDAQQQLERILGRCA